jgi:hypothetical protein
MSKTTKRGRPRGSKNKQRQVTPVKREGWRMWEYCVAHNVSRSAVYTGIKNGTIKTKHVGGCLIILGDAS